MATKAITKAFNALKDRSNLAQNGSLSVFDGVVYSYAEPIAHLLFGNRIAITAVKFGATTSKHCNGLRAIAADRGMEVVDKLNHPE